MTVELTRRELLALGGSAVIAGIGGTTLGAAARPTAATKTARLSACPLEDVRLLESPFLAAQRRDLDYLVGLQPDRLLHNFRVNAGLEPKAPVYGGWESEEP